MVSLPVLGLNKVIKQLVVVGPVTGNFLSDTVGHVESRDGLVEDGSELGNDDVGQDVDEKESREQGIWITSGISHVGHGDNGHTGKEEAEDLAGTENEVGGESVHTVWGQIVSSQETQSVLGTLTVGLSLDQNIWSGEGVDVLDKSLQNIDQAAEQASEDTLDEFLESSLCLITLLDPFL